MFTGPPPVPVITEVISRDSASGNTGISTAQAVLLKSGSNARCLRQYFLRIY